MRAVNTSAVLEYLRLAGPASRTEISQELNISKPTTMRIIDDLFEKGFVISTGVKEGGRGRSRDLLGINKAENHVIAIDIGGGHISSVLANIGGEIIDEFHEHRDWGSPDENFTILISVIQRMLEVVHNRGAKLLGIAIGIPGITDADDGVVVHAPSLDWENYPLLAKLKSHFELPILIENDVNLAVLGEYWFGAGKGVNNLVMIAIGTGIGAGIILDGKLHRGFSHSSGEIGYLIPGVQYLDNQYPGFGALETLTSGVGIAERGMEKRLKADSVKFLKEVDAIDVFQAARDGEDWALETINETVDLLSLAVANFTACVDPELIILGGGVSNADDLLIEPIKNRIAGVIPMVPRIEKSRLGVNAVHLGCVVLIFQVVSDYSVIYHG